MALDAVADYNFAVCGVADGTPTFFLSTVADDSKC